MVAVIDYDAGNVKRKLLKHSAMRHVLREIRRSSSEQIM